MSTDGILTAIAGTVNECDLEMSLTVMVGGSLVTGTLVSFKKWAESVTNAFEASPGEFTRSFGGAVGRALLQASDAAKLDSAGEAGPHFLHFVGARILSGGCEAASVTVWRCPIASVDGFCFGGSRVDPVT